MLTLFFLTDLNWLLTTLPRMQGIDLKAFWPPIVSTRVGLGNRDALGMASLIDDVTLHATRSMGAIQWPC
ncbi:MAG: hypothetical protein R3C12_16865 [Planctomycetaceae bacterium]